MGGDIIYRKRSDQIKNSNNEDALSEIVSSLALIIILVIAAGIILSFTTGNYPKETIPYADIKYQESVNGGYNYTTFLNNGGENFTPGTLRIRAYNDDGTIAEEFQPEHMALIYPDGSEDSDWKNSGTDYSYGYGLRIGPLVEKNLSYQILYTKGSGDYVYRQYGKGFSGNIVPTRTPIPGFDCSDLDAGFTTTHSGLTYTLNPTYACDEPECTHGWIISGTDFYKSYSGKSPKVTFPCIPSGSARSYSVTHWVAKNQKAGNNEYYPVCSQSLSQIITLSCTDPCDCCPPACTSDFSYQSTGRDVNFFGNEGADSWIWDFGDGSAPGEGQILSHMYLGMNAATVTLTTSKTHCGEKYQCRPVTKQITMGCSGDTDFNVLYDESSEKGKYNVTCTWNPGYFLYGRPYTVSWDFGDGKPRSTISSDDWTGSITHTYTDCSDKEYSITLSLDSGNCGSYSSTRSVRIPCICDVNPFANFSTQSIHKGTPFEISVTDASGIVTGHDIVTWLWDMGDGKGTFNNTSSDPPGTFSYAYPGCGEYSIHLTVYDSRGCWDETTREISCGGDSCTPGTPDANFTYVRQSDGKTFDFIDYSTPIGSIERWQWDFGEGSRLTVQNPSHTYSTYGSYTVKLRVWDFEGCWDDMYQDISTLCQKPVTNFTITKNSSDPQWFTFTDTSAIPSGLGATYAWNFGDEITALGPVQNHRYNTCGQYTVKLRVTTDCGLWDEKWIDAVCDGCPTPNVSFSSAKTGNYGEYQFTDHSYSSRPISWYWEFGDGTNSTQKNPLHTYSLCNDYTVRLKVTTDCGSSNTSYQNLFCACTPPEARFRIDPTTDPQEFRFINESLSSRPITSIFWEFGDGSSSTEQNPTHRYATCGQFTVRLKVTTDCGSSDDVIYDAICGCPPPKPDFEYACTGQTNVRFTDLSRAIGGGINAWYWEFGDLRPDNTSGLQNPNHKYDNPGTYPVNLTVFTTCNSSTRWTRFVTVPCCEMPVPGFTYACNPDGLTVDFSDTTKTSGDDISDWLWEFGDGNSSILQNPQYTYLRNGTWPVNLSVTTSCGAKNSYRESITTPCFCTLPVANFSTEIISGEPFMVRIRDTSQKPEMITHWNWSFGDGTYYTGQNPPDHTFAAGCGEYLISLTVTNECGARDTFDKLVCCPVYANFTYRMEPENGTAPLTVYFTDRTIGTPQSWGWTFGDGGVSSFRNPVYTYKSGGNYSATLHATSPCGGNETHSEQINVYCPPVEALFNYTIVNEDPLTVQFTDLSTGYDIVEWNWYFGDGSSSKEQNPVHTYYIRDDYQVILTIKNSCGSESTNSMYLPIGCLPLTIIATAHEGGYINPSGNVTVPCEWNQQFNITPDLCHTIRDVVIDENQPNVQHLGPVESYTFINVQYDQTIDAYFDLKQYQIASSADTGGTIDPLGITVVDCGSDQSFNITAGFCFNITDVIINGTQHLGPQVSPFTYTFTNVTSDQSIHAMFAMKTFPINATAGTGGSISPPGITLVPCGYDQTYSITNLTCWNISDVRVDGTSMGPIRSYTFTNVTEPHNISALFVPRGPYNITSSSAILSPDGILLPNPGRISPEGIVTVPCGGSQTYTMTSTYNAGGNTWYRLSEVRIDGLPVGIINPYTFTNVQRDHTIIAIYTTTCQVVTGLITNSTGQAVGGLRVELYDRPGTTFIRYTISLPDGTYTLPAPVTSSERFRVKLPNVVTSPTWTTSGWVLRYVGSGTSVTGSGEMTDEFNINQAAQCNAIVNWTGTGVSR